ncbi:MAG: hypothetical protein HY075_12395, partial [Deltaproteobacteria bacterium]|nr:hypothetical protein [Deltaproteobacteria bacterium]
AAQVSWSSGDLVPLAQRVVLEFRPHTLVVLAGNNEWIRWSAPGQPSMAPWALSTLRALAESRLVSAAMAVWLSFVGRHQDQLRRFGPGFHVDFELTGADYALKHPAERYAPFDGSAWHETKKRFLDTFEARLSEIVTFARAHGVRVILMAVPFSYKLSPAWRHPQPESFIAQYRDEVRAAVARGAELVARRDCEGALKVLRAAQAKDPEPPILSYLEATCLDELGRPLEAEAAYARSRENMIGNLGARLSINERIRRVALRHGAELVDLPKIFDEFEHQRGRYFNEELIADGCHPTPLGAELIAKALRARFR